MRCNNCVIIGNRICLHQTLAEKEYQREVTAEDKWLKDYYLKEELLTLLNQEWLTELDEERIEELESLLFIWEE